MRAALTQSEEESWQRSRRPEPRDEPPLSSGADRSEEDELNLDPAFPFVMSSGNHMDTNANTAMRDPAWNDGKRACTLCMNPRDAEANGFQDGQLVRVTTDVGQETIELEVTEATRPGYLLMPQGFGMTHQGTTVGANANRLATHRDRLAATPYHRWVPCRVEAAS
jgi:anaerobic selenocysteine-containing dehydrogenase